MVEAIHFFQNSCPLFSFDNSLVKEDSKRYENAVIHGDNEWIFHVPCFEPGMEENRMELILGNFFHTKSTAVLTFNEFLKASAFAFAIFHDLAMLCTKIYTSFPQNRRLIHKICG